MLPHRSSVVLIAFTGAILVTVALSIVLGWHWYWAWWTGSSLVAFLLYGYDKLQARRGGLRVPEVVLHLLALAGGVAGAWLGRIVFRHKTQHFLFTVVLVLATIVHVGVWLSFVGGP